VSATPTNPLPVEENRSTACDFLNISFDSRMASLVGADRSAIPAEEHNTLARSESILAKPNRIELIS
jgi:hypothetical protein